MTIYLIYWVQKFYKIINNINCDCIFGINAWSQKFLERFLDNWATGIASKKSLIIDTTMSISFDY